MGASEGQLRPLARASRLASTPCSAAGAQHTPSGCACSAAASSQLSQLSLLQKQQRSRRQHSGAVRAEQLQPPSRGRLGRGSSQLSPAGAHASTAAAAAAPTAAAAAAPARGQRRFACCCCRPGLGSWHCCLTASCPPFSSAGAARDAAGAAGASAPVTAAEAPSSSSSSSRRHALRALQAPAPAATAAASAAVVVSWPSACSPEAPAAPLGGRAVCIAAAQQLHSVQLQVPQQSSRRQSLPGHCGSDCSCCCSSCCCRGHCCSVCSPCPCSSCSSCSPSSSSRGGGARGASSCSCCSCRDPQHIAVEGHSRQPEAPHHNVNDILHSGSAGLLLSLSCSCCCCWGSCPGSRLLQLAELPAPSRVLQQQGLRTAAAPQSRLRTAGRRAQLDQGHSGAAAAVELQQHPQVAAAAASAPARASQLRQQRRRRHAAGRQRRRPLLQRLLQTLQLQRQRLQRRLLQQPLLLPSWQCPPAHEGQPLS